MPASSGFCTNYYKLHHPFRSLCRLQKIFNSDLSLNYIKLSILNYLILHPYNLHKFKNRLAFINFINIINDKTQQNVLHFYLFNL